MAVKKTTKPSATKTSAPKKAASPVKAASSSSAPKKTAAAPKKAAPAAPKKAAAAAPKKASSPVKAAAPAPKKASAPAPKKAAAPKKKAVVVKLTDPQSGLLKKVAEAKESGYPATPSENRMIESLQTKKLIKRGQKNPQGRYHYLVTKTGEKHLTTPAAPPKD